MPLLSLLDTRAKPKGSRDPLGFESIWMGLGRKLIGNLTTITGSTENFAVAILGFKWAHDHVSALKPVPDAPHKEIREYFLKYEQLAAYLRHDSKSDILGISRVKDRLAQAKPITLGLKASQQILSNQASYGLWGLYSSASRASGLVSGGDRTPTELGLEIAHLIEERMGTLVTQLKSAIDQASPLDFAQLTEWQSDFIAGIRDTSAQEKLFDALIQGPKDHQVQRQLWAEVQEWLPLSTSEDGYQVLAEYLSTRSKNETIRHLAQAITETERILVLANQLFTLGRQSGNKNLSDLEHLANEHVDASSLPHSLSIELTESQRTQLSPFFTAAQNRDWKAAFLALVKMNDDIMKDRDGAPWIRIEGNQKLSVRVADETTRLLPIEELPTAWNYDYFLNSLLKIVNQSAPVTHG